MHAAFNHYMYNYTFKPGEWTMDKCLRKSSTSYKQIR